MHDAHQPHALSLVGAVVRGALALPHPCVPFITDWPLVSDEAIHLKYYLPIEEFALKSLLEEGYWPNVR